MVKFLIANGAEKNDEINDFYNESYKTVLGVSLSEQYIEGSKYYHKGMYKEAFDYFHYRAQKGDNLAKLVVGRMYEVGHGINPDIREAFSWYEKAAMNGNTDAQQELAFRYFSGAGVPASIDDAVKWYKKVSSVSEKAFKSPQEYRAATTMSALILGLVYDRCDHQSKDVIRNLCATILTSDFSTPKDYKQAIVWYGKAAEMGIPNAQIPLGVMLHNGKFVPKDNIHASMWLTIALELLPPGEDRDYAYSVRNKVLKEMSKIEIEKAKELVKGWRPK